MQRDKTQTALGPRHMECGGKKMLLSRAAGDDKVGFTKGKRWRGLCIQRRGSES